MANIREETLTKMEEYRSRIDAGESIYDYGESLCNLIDSIHKNFHHLFDHWAMKAYIHSLYLSGYDVSLGTVNGEGCDSKEPQDVMDIYEELVALDQKLTSGELHYIFHIQTEQDYWCCQMWVSTPDIYKEYLDAYDNSCNEQSRHWRYIPSELFVLGSFLEKYELDPRLTELWAGPY